MLTLDDITGAVDDIDDDPQLIEEYPDEVPGRVAHIDADFLAYMAAYERKGEEASLDDILFKTRTMIRDKRREAGAEKAVLHLTPNTSNKGGRYDIAIQKKYQGQRSSDDKPRYLEAVRDFMAGLDGQERGVAWETAEADDGMAQAGWENYRAGTSDLCVIVTKDKDLRMVPSLHMDWDSGMIRDTSQDPFGWIGIREKVGNNGKITKKYDGWGTKFFWLQMLMGDTADNIQGLPKAPVGKDGKMVSCGQIAAVKLLADAKNDRECLRICMDLYKQNDYVHWQKGDTHSWQDVFWSEAQMLWMQRTPGDIDDVKKWVKEFLT